MLGAALACAMPLLAVAAGAADAEESCALQTTQRSRRTEMLLQAEAAEAVMRAESDEVHVTFVTDCHAHNLWQSELLFLSAQRVGQRGPVTQILSGCSPEAQKLVEERHGTLGLPKHFKQSFVAEFNTKDSHVINKVYGFAKWFRDVGPERDVVSIIDPDFIFVRPLTTVLDGAKDAFGWDGVQRPEKVVKGVIAAQRWPMAWMTHSQAPWASSITDHPDGMTQGEVLTWVCSGSKTGDSGCDGATQEEVSFYHSTGVPYLAHRADWDEKLLDNWVNITERLHQVYHGYYVDMWSWTMTSLHLRMRQLAVTDLMLRDPHVRQRSYGELEKWAEIDETAADPCKDPMNEVLADPKIPNFIHYCQPNAAFNKYWFDSMGDHGPHVLQRCDATAEDPHLRQLVAGQVNKSDSRWVFLNCVERRMFAAALMKTCAGRPAAKAVEGIAAGFAF